MQVSDDPILSALPLGLGPIDLLGLDQVEEGSIRPAAATFTDQALIDLSRNRRPLRFNKGQDGLSTALSKPATWTSSRTAGAFL